MKYAGLTDIGRYRSENQDSFEIIVYNQNTVLAIVCDGMGGAAGGKIASSLAISSFLSQFEKLLKEKNISFDDKNSCNLDILEEMMKDSVKEANRIIFEYAQNDVGLIGMGTTLVACLVIGRDCLVCNVGDSRLYHLTKTSMRQITRDHSYVQMLIDTGMLEKKLAAAHPDRNVIVRAVGTRAGVTAETFRFTLNANETVLLCSDGLSGYVSNEQIYSLLWGSEDIFKHDEKKKAFSLIQAANDGGGRDNITAVILTY